MRWAGSGFLTVRRSHRETVGSERSKPNLSNSPWTRGAPHVGFSAAMRAIKARTSLLTLRRPPTRLALESHFQYSRKPARCQPTTVRGVTKTRGFCHPDQRLRNMSQNSLCHALSRRRGLLACSASSCWRRARFSRIISRREPKVLTIQPSTWRRRKIMAGILSKDFATAVAQVTHSTRV